MAPRGQLNRSMPPILKSRPLAPKQLPCKGLEDGRKAHFACYLDHEAEQEKHPGR